MGIYGEFDVDVFHLLRARGLPSGRAWKLFKRGYDFWCRWCDVIPGRTADSVTRPERPGWQW